MWQYRGGKIEIPTYIFDEPYDVVSGLLRATHIRPVYRAYAAKKKSGSTFYRKGHGKRI